MPRSPKKDRKGLKDAAASEVSVFSRDNGTFLLSLRPEEVAEPSEFFSTLAKLPLRGGLARLNKKVIDRWLKYFQQSLPKWGEAEQIGTYKALGDLLIKCYKTEQVSMRILLETLDPDGILHKKSYPKRSSVEELGPFELACYTAQADIGKAITILRTNPPLNDKAAAFESLVADPTKCSPYLFYHHLACQYELLREDESINEWGNEYGVHEYAHKKYQDLIKTFIAHVSKNIEGVDDEDELAQVAAFKKVIKSDDRIPGLLATIYHTEYERRNRHVERHLILAEAQEWAGLGSIGINLKSGVTEPMACLVMGRCLEIAELPPEKFQKFLDVYYAHAPVAPARDYPESAKSLPNNYAS